MTKQIRLKRVIAWLLAVLVISGSVSPLAFQHAHTGGDVAHDHRTQSGHRHDESHQHHGHSHLYHHATDDHGASETGGTAEHVHVNLLGFDFTLPASDDSDPNSSDSQRDDVPVIVRMMDECVPNVGHGSMTTHSAPKLDILSAIAVSTVHSRNYAQPMDPSVLLCDAARHERSGVLRF